MKIRDKLILAFLLTLLPILSAGAFLLVGEWHARERQFKQSQQDLARVVAEATEASLTDFVRMEQVLAQEFAEVIRARLTRSSRLVLLDPQGTLICYSGAAPSMAERVQWSRDPIVRGTLAMGHAESDHFYAPHEAERTLCSLVRVPE